MNNQKDESWQNLQSIIAGIENVQKDDRQKVLGLVRRSIILVEEEKQALNTILCLDDIKTLATLLDTINIVPPDEAIKQIKELALSTQEQEEEMVHWAFRRQSIHGEFLINESLVPFRFIKIDQYISMLLANMNNPDIPKAFSICLKKPHDLFNNKAFQVENENWAAWAWVNFPNRQQQSEALEKMRALWK
jgi:hypothetical protein